MSPDAARPEGACTGCPYRSRCHEPRRYVMAQLGEGRHRLCDFNQSFRAREDTMRSRNLPRIKVPISSLIRLVLGLLKKRS